MKISLELEIDDEDWEKWRLWERKENYGQNLDPIETLIRMDGAMELEAERHFKSATITKETI